MPACAQGGSFKCAVPLRQRKNQIAAVARHSGAESEDTVTVLWDKGSRPRYRLSVDDNILFLMDLGRRPEDYRSLFDHWYLEFWRQMHEQYGAKIHMNIYYQTMFGHFTLRQMPDKWRDEWEANSDWLRLSFHALQCEPSRPYRNASYERMAHDYDLVVAEIKRFAGASALGPVTTVHFAEAPADACRALHDRGIRVLVAIFHSGPAECTTGYYLAESVKHHASTRDHYYDAEADLIFITVDAIVNEFRPQEIDPWLDRQAASLHTGELIELLIHEHFFRRELPCYRPHMQDSVIRSLRWVTDRGYQPVFWGDGFLGNPITV